MERRNGIHNALRRCEVVRERGLLAFLLVCALALQCYLTQTHIHIMALPSQGEIYDEVGGFDLSLRHHGKPDDPAHCPFCQALAMSGDYFVPAAPILPAPIALPVFEQQIPRVVLHDASLPHDWQSRAPPVA